jgi:hypothetical protein
LQLCDVRSRSASPRYSIDVHAAPNLGQIEKINDMFDAVGLISFRRFRSSSLALVSLDRACRDHRPDFSATLTTMDFDHSSLRWLGISDLIAEPEGPSYA